MSKVITQLIHQINHINTNNYASIMKNNLDNQSIIEIIENNDKIYHLNIGVYTILLNNIYYIFHAYLPTLEEDNYVYIDSPINSYIKIGIKKFPIILYKRILLTDDNEYITQLNNTVNNYIDLMIINGYSYTEISDDYLLDHIISLQNDTNSSFDDIDFVEQAHGAVNIEDSGNVGVIRSIRKIELETSDQNGHTHSIYLQLKNPLRSLPNLIHDTIIINAEKQLCQVIHRISRRVFIGSDNWTFVSKNSTTALFYLNDNNIKKENNGTVEYNIRCTHFVCTQTSVLLDTNYDTPGIATAYGEYNNGIFIRVLLDNIDSNDLINSFNRWIANEFHNYTPMMIEYQLTNPIYKTYLLDEYHLKSFYPITNINNMNSHIVSYCYKSLEIGGAT